MAKTVVGVFDDIDEARFALDQLQSEGYTRADISLIASDADRRFSSLVDNNVPVDRTEDTGEAAVEGLGVGAVIGGLAGFIVGLAALSVPGVGPILAAGPLASLLVGAEVGGLAGGIIGGLTHLGVPEHDVHYYDERVRHGATLLVLRTDDSLAEHAAVIMRDNGATNVDGEHAQAPSTGDVAEDEPRHYLPTAAAAAAAGAANFASITGSPGAPGAVVGALTAPAAGEEAADGDSEHPMPGEYTVVDKRSRERETEEHDRDDVEAEQQYLHRQV